MTPMSMAGEPRENWLFRTRRNLLLLCPVAAVLLFTAVTIACLKPVTRSFASITADSQSVPMTDRNGQPLSITYQTAWNTLDVRPLYAMPPLLQESFLYSEDRKFFTHGGVDWKGRVSALWQNLRHGRTVRGASTITEQVVRMINPRPRTLWSKWLEGIEATMLEQRASKPSILEFYLNQVPYAGNRRGVTQAARYYFNRDVATLSPKETLALVILARAPSSYDLYKDKTRLDDPLIRLATQMQDAGKLAPGTYRDITQETLAILKPSMPVDARHFARFVMLDRPGTIVRTTLDSSLQSQVQAIIDGRLKKLKDKHVSNAGALVIDHETGDILAWVVGGATDPDTKGGEIDTVTVPRQPGSTLKPLLYALALEKGWTAATILNDAPIAEAVGSGLHRFRNYSNTYYGPITVREALGNSLNIPAVLAINYVGVDNFLTTLHRLGFNSLTRDAQVYDEGLALGNGEVTLYELTRAYATLARRGVYRDLRYTLSRDDASNATRVYTDDVSSIIGNILSDPYARSIEFGRDSLLNLPVRTAAKTGTSTDYRDAWTVGYNDRYTVGIWMGNLDRTPMKDVTGSTGPTLALRAIFNILNRDRDTKPLYLSPRLVEKDICMRPTQDEATCPRRTEWFVAGTENSVGNLPPHPSKAELVRPTQGLMIAHDPRIPADHQKFRFELANLQSGDQAEWILNGERLAQTNDGRYLWPVTKGKQTLSVTIRHADGALEQLAPVDFMVK